MKHLIMTLALLTAGVNVASGAVRVAVVGDGKEMLSGAPYTGRLEIVVDAGGAEPCDCIFNVLHPCLRYDIQKPGGQLVTFASSTLGTYINWGNGSEFTIPPNGRLVVPVCLGWLDGEPVFDDVGEYTITARVRLYGKNEALVASGRVTVTGRGRGYDRYMAFMRRRSPSLFMPCYWVVDGVEEMQQAAGALGPNTDYDRVIATLYAYQIGAGTMRQLMRVAYGECSDEDWRGRRQLEKDLALGVVASQKAGVNEAFWRRCQAIYESNVIGGVKLQDEMEEDIVRFF